MHDKINISFQHTECPEESILKAYVNHGLSKSENRTVELHMADCEMCSDYIEGLSLLSGSDELEKEGAFIVSEINNDRSKKNKLWFYASAASVLLAISIFSIIWFMPVNNNFVAQELNEEQKLEKTGDLRDSMTTGLDGLFKNSSEVISGDVLSNEQENQQEEKSIAEKDQAEINDRDDFSRKGSPAEQDILQIIEDAPGNEDKSKSFETKSENSVVTSNDAYYYKTTISGESKSPVGGVTVNNEEIKEVETISTGKNNKKNNREAAKQKDSKTVTDEVAKADVAPAIFARTESTVNQNNLDDMENIESNLDLDKANMFLQQQMTDSAVVYAIRATTSCDSCIWTAKLLLSKSYIAAGDIEKAVATLKEVKSKAPAKYAKTAKEELEKLGY